MSPTANSVRPDAGEPLTDGELVASVCHRLRTPLTAALGFLQLSVREIARSETPLESLRMVDEQLRRMSRLIDELAEKATAAE